MKLLMGTILFLSAVGCVSQTKTLQRFTSARLGCPAAETTVSNIDNALNSSTWEAECRGRRVFCSSVMMPTGAIVMTCNDEIGDSKATAKGPSTSSIK